ncbi:13221_t:CDS:2 [Rhizophagus irregularis]|nr:13221_t:CDS:2 [Rhizophagus irregularis]
MQMILFVTFELGLHRKIKNQQKIKMDDEGCFIEVNILTCAFDEATYLPIPSDR